jgi:hypothetical protein
LKTRFAVLVLLMAIPMMGFSQSTLNFPKLFSAAELPVTGFAIVNPNTATATVAYTLYAANGTTVSSSSKPISAGGQLALSGDQLFSTLGSGGWVQATSSASGLVGFWLNYSGTLSFIDGAEAASTATDLIIPLVAGQTEVNVANPNTAAASVTIKLVGEAGTDLATAVTQSIAGSGVFSSQASALFPSADLSLARYVRVTSAGGAVAATALIKGYLVTTDSGVINGVDRSSTVSEADFPHVINGALTGANYTTVIGVTNLSSTAQAVTITFTPTVGSATSVQKTIAGSGSLRSTAQDLFGFGAGFQDGWVKVAGTAGITGFAAYGDTIGGAIAVVPTGSARTNMMFAHIADGPAITVPWQTGLAFLNTGTTAASIDLYAMTPAGVLIGASKGIVLAAGKKVADQLHNLIPAAKGQNGGFIFARSTVPLYAIELFYTEDLKILSNVAAGPGSAYAPPEPATPLTLTSISPTTANRGGSITLTGSGFSSTAASNTVVFTSGPAPFTVNATPTDATATSLTVTVPATAINGPVLVQVGGQSSAAKILTVNASSTSLPLPSTVSVAGSATTTGVDLYVPAGAPGLNLIQIGVGDVGTGITPGSSSIDVPRGATKQLLLTGTGMTQANATTVSISGSGVTLKDTTYQGGAIFVTITVDATAATGSRNVVVTNSNLDVSILSGGLFIR